MRKHGGTPSWRDKHVTPAAISPPGVARGRFAGGQQSGLAGCKPPLLSTSGASSCSSQGRRQGEPRGASPRPSAPTYLPGPLLPPICLVAISGMSAIVLHAHFQKLGPAEWLKLPEQDRAPLSASHSCRATQGTNIQSLIDRILTDPEIFCIPMNVPRILRSRRL